MSDAVPDDFHGEVTGYVNRGCKCDECRESWKQYQVARRVARQRVVDIHREEYRRYMNEEQARMKLRVVTVKPKRDDPYALGYEAGKLAGREDALRSLRDFILGSL